MIRFGSILGRYLLVWAAFGLSLLLATTLFPGLDLDTTQPYWWLALVVLPVEFAVLVILLRPLILFLTLPLNMLTLGLPSLLINVVILYFTARSQPAVVITSQADAILGILVMTVISLTIVSALGLDEAYPLYQTLLYRFGRRIGPRPTGRTRRGLLILQVDGLSYRALVRVLGRGRMPTVSALLARRSHRLYRWRSGLPSNTPAAQSGLLYGVREDVPGYRWFDRQEQRIRVVSHPADARDLEERVAAASSGALLAGGSCVNTLLSGGAAKRLLTVSALAEGVREGRRAERADLGLFYLSPSAYPRALLAAAWDYLAGFTLGVIGLLHPDRPRLRHHPIRLAQGALANAFLRSLSFFWLKQDVARGIPVIYSNFVGYDDVAHVTDPVSFVAQNALSAFDRNLRQLRRFARREAPLDYEVVLLSDHGHSLSVPFRLLYGQTLNEFLAELAGRSVAGETVLTHEAAYLETLLAELEAGRFRPTWAMRRGRSTLAGLRARRMRDAPVGRSPAGGSVALPPPSLTGDDVLELIARRREAAAASGEAEAVPELVVCVSGCLAHIYFKGNSAPLQLEEILARWPSLLAGLISHPGIGFVAASRQYGDAVVIGKEGVRNLITGQMAGRRDPLASYGEPDVWAPELAQLLGFPSSGDLVINGTWLADQRKVVVLEEQTSSHGGLGGPQTEAFVVLPSDWQTVAGDLVGPEALHRHILRNLKRLKEEAVPDFSGERVARPESS